ncbi:hypothetical protein BS47DRAFT_495459 [Hydnum rufescens UP504]|uniref:Uncharacterized protein n=1 Tax=Hydnum rufescens UP504 TaxID=1448309 RepID=A0A9P6AHD4_9AGAM|nr:hypothetical protein BS47DRAFT_495459 [Hydnum rufescens UP504]
MCPQTSSIPVATYGANRARKIPSDQIKYNSPSQRPFLFRLGVSAVAFHSTAHFDPALVPHPPPVLPPVGVAVTPGGGTTAGRANESRPSSAGKSTGGMVAGRPFSKRSEEHLLGLPISSARDDSAVKGRNMSVGDGHERVGVSQSQGEEGSDR